MPRKYEHLNPKGDKFKKWRTKVANKNEHNSITKKPVHQPKLRQQQQGTETATEPRDKASQRQTNGNKAKDNAAMLRDKRERKAQEGDK